MDWEWLLPVQAGLDGMLSLAPYGLRRCVFRTVKVPASNDNAVIAMPGSTSGATGLQFGAGGGVA